MSVDEATPRVVQLRLGLVLGEAAHDLGRLHQRVVGAERHRRMARRARHAQGAPEGALLADDHRQAHASAEVHGEAAGLGEHVVGDDVLALVVDEVVGAVGAERLLVGDAEVDERSLRL